MVALDVHIYIIRRSGNPERSQLLGSMSLACPAPHQAEFCHKPQASSEMSNNCLEEKVILTVPLHLSPLATLIVSFMQSSCVSPQAKLCSSTNQLPSTIASSLSLASLSTASNYEHHGSMWTSLESGIAVLAYCSACRRIQC